MRFILFFIILPLFCEVVSPNPFSKPIDSRSTCGVNPVSGEFWLREEDLILSGVQPLTFVRTENGILPHLYIDLMDNNFVEVIDDDGTKTMCKANGSAAYLFIPNGKTDLTPQTNPHNLRCDRNGDFIKVTFPNKKVRCYGFYEELVSKHHLTKRALKKYRLNEEHLPNGYIYRYHYDGIYVKRIEILTPKLNVIGFCEFTHKIIKGPKPGIDTIGIHTSQGRYFEYRHCNGKYTTFSRNGKLIDRLDRYPDGRVSYRLPSNGDPTYVNYDEAGKKIIWMRQNATPDGKLVDVQQFSYGDNQFRFQDLTKPIIGRNIPQGHTVITDSAGVVTIQYHTENTVRHTQKIYKPHAPFGNASKEAQKEQNIRQSVKAFLGFGSDYKQKKVIEANRPNASEEFLLEYDIEGLLKRKVQFKFGTPIYYETYEYNKSYGVTRIDRYGDFTGRDSLDIYMSNESIENRSADQSTTLIEYTEDGLIQKIVHPQGLEQQFSYLPHTNLCIEEKTFQSGELVKLVTRSYNQYHNLISEITQDPKYGMEHSVRYECSSENNSFGLPVKVEEFVGDTLFKRSHFSYDHRGVLTSTSTYDSEGKLWNEINYTYDDQEQLIEVKDHRGHGKRYQYNGRGLLEKEIDLISNIDESYLYDNANRMIAKTCLGMTECFQYNSKNLLEEKIDPFGNKISYQYNHMGRLTEAKMPSLYGSAIWLGYAYDDLGHISFERTIDGFQIDYESTYAGSRKKAIFKDGTIERFRYDLAGKLIYTRRPDGREAHTLYDSLGRVVRSQNEDRVNTFTHSIFGPISKEEFDGTRTEYVYDKGGRLIREVLLKKSHTLTTDFLYDVRGQLIEKRVLPFKTITRYTYDEFGSITSETQCDFDEKIHSRIETVYDVRRRIIETRVLTGASYAITKTEYDDFNRPTKIIDPEGLITTLEYDSNHLDPWGNRVEKKTLNLPDGTTQIEIADTHHNLHVREIHFEKRLFQKEEFHRNALGKVLRQISTVIDQNGAQSIRETHFVYGLKQELLQQIEDATNQSRVTSFTYTPAGKIATKTKPDGTVLRYEYDVYDQLTRLSSSDHTVDYGYLYSSEGWLTQVEDRILGRVSRYSYDIGGNLLKEEFANGLFLEFEFDETSRRSKVTLPDGSSVRYAYDAFTMKQVSRFDAKGALRYQHSYTSFHPGGKLSQEELPFKLGKSTYSVDIKNRTTHILSPYRSESVPQFNANNAPLSRDVNGEISEYRFDPLNQLISEPTHTYTYDSHFTRKSKDDRTYTTDTQHQLLDEVKSSYRYNLMGNRSEKNSERAVQYRYDALDRLIEVRSASCSEKYTYDHSNRRMTLEYFEEEKLKEEKRFLWDELVEIGAYTGKELVEFRVLGIGKGGDVSASVAIEIANKVYIPLHDLFGNITTLITQYGYIAQSLTYTAFGETDVTPLSPWGYQSKRYSKRTGLYYYGQRFYDPAIGSFITPDPKGLEEIPNPYMFAKNNPLVYFDMYGLADLSISPVFTEITSYNSAFISQVLGQNYSSLVWKDQGLINRSSAREAIIQPITSTNTVTANIKECSEKFFAISGLLWWGEEIFLSLLNDKAFVIECNTHLPPGPCDIYVNLGMFNTVEDTYDTIKFFKDNLKMSFKVICDPQLSDKTAEVIKTIGAYCGQDTAASILLADLIGASITNNPNRPILIFVHSRGNINILNAIRTLEAKKCDLEKLFICSYGSPVQFHKSTVYRASGIISKGDPVGRIGRFAEQIMRFVSNTLIAVAYKDMLHALPPNSVNFKDDLALDLVTSTDGSLEHGLLTAGVYREDLMDVMNYLNKYKGDK